MASKTMQITSHTKDHPDQFPMSYIRFIAFINNSRLIYKSVHMIDQNMRWIRDK